MKKDKHNLFLFLGLDTRKFVSDSDGVPTEIHIVPLGQYEHEMYGNFTIADADIDNMIQNFNNHENDLVIDFEHQTLTGEKAPAAGWIYAIEKREDGIWAVDVKFTKSAIEHIRSEEYRYISPVIDFQALDKTTGNGIGAKIHSIALTNTPWFDGMQPLAAKESKGSDLITVGIYKTNINLNNEEDSQMFGKIREMFKLDAALSDDKVIEFLQKFYDNSASGDEALKGIFKDFKLEEGVGLPGIVAKFKEITAENDKLKSTKTDLEKTVADTLKQVTELVLKDVKREAEKMVEEASKAGKILPEMKGSFLKLAEKDPKQFTEMIKSMPKVVNFEQVFKPGVDTGTDDGSATAEFINKVKKAKEKDSKLTEGEAQKLVCKENPDLAKRYLADQQR